MKNKGVIISIIIILCFGAFVTVNIRRLVTFNAESEAPSETYKGSMLPEVGMDTVTVPSPQAGAGVVPPVNAETAPGADAAPQAPVPENAVMAETAAAAGPEVQQKKAESTVISPLTGSQEAGKETSVSTLSREAYEKKFLDLDSRIRKMKDSGVGPNTDSYKNMADYEYRSWDGELNAVYQALLRCMEEKEAEALRVNEREWMKERDLTARKAISKYNGGTIESLEYTVSLAESTRTRAYELLEEYGGYLNDTLIEQEEETEAETAE